MNEESVHVLVMAMEKMDLSNNPFLHETPFIDSNNQNPPPEKRAVSNLPLTLYGLMEQKKWIAHKVDDASTASGKPISLRH